MEAPSENGFYFYVLWCADQTLYTGYTVNLKQRVARHNSGQGAKYTRFLNVVRFSCFIMKALKTSMMQ